MDDNKTSFVFYRDWYDMVKDESDDIRLMFFDAIPKYAFDGIIPDCADIRLAFKQVMMQIQRDQSKYDAVRVKRAEAGRKGNEKRWQKSQSIAHKNKIANIANANKCDEAIANVATIADNDNVNVNDNVTNNNDSNMVLDKSNTRDLSQITPCDKLNYQSILVYYNLHAKGKLPQLSALTDKRKSAIKARISEYSEEQLYEVIDKACESIFMQEHHLAFDWFMRPNNFPKVLEGNYDNKQQRGREMISTKKFEDW